ncbi:hypothetical protein [Microbacterium candidum]|uniref:Uncharacterized protein n=1 Tax=Microbacterium candidum TaxID=3041922 RepID=A0ABT7N2K7_9MICO|nr:hypothetical protein [Microbacterium sp. ASV49]MDL9980934.1 hypothetical protein [Microbacterium sp. ASV49]
MTVALLAGSSALAAPHGAKKSPPPAPSASYSCATFSGLTLAQQSVSYNGVALRAGQTITANVGPLPSTYGIDLTSTLGSTFSFWAAPVSSGLAFRAPADGVYNFGWSIDTGGQGLGTTVPTWRFACS